MHIRLSQRILRSCLIAAALLAPALAVAYLGFNSGVNASTWRTQAVVVARVQRIKVAKRYASGELMAAKVKVQAVLATQFFVPTHMTLQYTTASYNLGDFPTLKAHDLILACISRRGKGNWRIPSATGWKFMHGAIVKVVRNIRGRAVRAAEPLLQKELHAAWRDWAAHHTASKRP